MCYIKKLSLEKLIQIIKADSFERKLFEELEATSQELKTLSERGSHPPLNFRSLVTDLFESFFKYSVFCLPDGSKGD